MSTLLMQPTELRSRGFEVLANSLGWVNAVRFIQQYEPSVLNYAAERDTILPNWDAAEMTQQMNALESSK